MSNTDYGLKLKGIGNFSTAVYLFDGISRGFKIVGSYWPHLGRPAELPPLSACYEAVSVECAAWFRVPGGSTLLPSVPLGHNTYFTRMFAASGSRSDGVYDYYQYFYLHKLVLQELVPSDGFSEDGNRYGMNIRDEAGNLAFTTNREMAIISKVIDMRYSQVINNNSHTRDTLSEYLLMLSDVYPINLNQGSWNCVTGVHKEADYLLSYNSHPRRWRAIPTSTLLTEAQVLNSAYVSGRVETAPALLIARPPAYTIYKNF